MSKRLHPFIRKNAPQKNIEKEIEENSHLRVFTLRTFYLLEQK